MDVHEDAIHDRDLTGRRLEQPILIVIDEAAHLHLGWRPTEVSAIAALDAYVVTR